MLIERPSKEITIRLPASVDTTGLQQLVDYLTYKEATANSKAIQEQVDKLASDIKKGWWKKNRKRFIKCGTSLTNKSALTTQIPEFYASY